ncbi:hypothetical protein RY27_25690 [Litorilinea aerophila]|nr:hypothetical protein RY27_25690 [Litorilinea aerophila]
MAPGSRDVNNPFFSTSTRLEDLKWIHAMMMVNGYCGVSIVNGYRQFIPTWIERQRIDPILHHAIVLNGLNVIPFINRIRAIHMRAILPVDGQAKGRSKDTFVAFVVNTHTKGGTLLELVHRFPLLIA